MPKQLKFNVKIKAFLILFLFVGAQSVYANNGKAFSVEGDVKINGEPLTPETVIKEGDVIEAGENSAAKVVMKDGTVIDIQANSAFKVSKYVYNEEDSEKNTSKFAVLKGAFTYISGLIAKKDPKKTGLTAGTATIGIRGTFVNLNYSGLEVTADGSGTFTLAVQTDIGEALLTMPDGSTVTVSAGSRASNAGGSLTTTSVPPSPVAAAAIAMAANPEGAAAALGTMSAADAALVISTLLNNASSLGASKASVLAAVSNVVKAQPALATGLAYVASAVSPADKASFAATIKAAAPDQAAAIDAASNSGSTLAPAPASGTGDSVFPLRTEIQDDGSAS